MIAKSLTRKVHLITAALLTLFFFYIDEGFYSFKWMLEPGAWLAYSIYVGIIWGFQLLLSLFFNLILKEPARSWLSTFTVSVLGLVFFVFVVFDYSHS